MKTCRIPLSILAVAFLAAFLVPAHVPADDGVLPAPVPAAAVPSVEPVIPAACSAPAAPENGLLAPLPGEPIAMSCGSECTAAYFSCLDDCDAWPYPGCQTDCRNAYNACRLACLGG